MPEASSIVGDLRRILEEVVSPSVTLLKVQVEELRKDTDALASKVDKLDARIDSRFDRLEQMIGLTQTVQQV